MKLYKNNPTGYNNSKILHTARQFTKVTKYSNRIKIEGETFSAPDNDFS